MGLGVLAGLGYSAALLACLTGPAGQVTTVELDRGIAAEDRANSASHDSNAARKR